MGTLRFLLAMVVVLFHYQTLGSGMMDAHTAVKMFFIISGFYMAMILDQKYGRALGGLRAFAINRFLRLYPLYAVVLILTIGWYLTCLVLIGDRTPVPPIIALGDNLAWWQSAGIWISNLSLIGLDFVSCWDWVPEEGLVFLQPKTAARNDAAVSLQGTVWVVQAWSISMEILFYLSAPFLARCKSATQVGVIVVSLGCDLWLSLGLGRVTYFFAPAQWYLFVAGMLAYRGYKRFDVNAWVARARSKAIAITVILFAIIWSLPLLMDSQPQKIMLFASVLLIPVLFALSKTSKWDRAVGNLSYPIYLSHLIVGQVLGVVLARTGLSEGAILVIMPLGCVAAAVVLHQAVERPIEGIRSAISARLTGATTSNG
jgi:peptidoglycan/LPS O-acetylase OafA/YrhL